MTMKDMHGLECRQCKIRDQFYEDFNSDSKKNVSYFGVISYVNHYLVMPVSSDQSKEELSKNGQSYKASNVCFLRLINEWAIRDLISKPIKRKNGLIKHLKEKKRKPYTKTPSFYLPEHTGNLITIKKSESFTESSPDDTICSVNLKTTKDVYKCELTKKSSSKEKVARKEPKVGTLKRKRWNAAKLKQNESYEDDLFEEKKLKRVIIEDSTSYNSEEDKMPTPTWSVTFSPRVQSPSPSYEDCYSPTELQKSRKVAEEYQYSRRKRLDVCKKRNDSRAKMKEDPVTYGKLVESKRKLKNFKKMMKQESDSEEEKDKYFTSSEDDCSD